MTDRLRLAGLMLAALGLGVAAYLTYVHYAGIEPVCTGGGGCEKVQTSEYSKVAGVPVSLLGLLGYAAILAALLVDGEVAALAAAGLAIVGFGFSAYLQYRSLVTIDATCVWCLASACIMTVLAGVTVTRAVRYPT